MSDDLDANFEKHFASGTTIRAAFRSFRGAPSIAALFGPSGCGKTTVLRSLAGLERPDRGTIRFGGATWFDSRSRTCLAPQQRSIGYLFQDYALFPHLPVEANIAYGLRTASTSERRRLVNEIAGKLHIESLLDRSPRQLSGGEQQRVALARAIVRRPGLLLLDEPLSALDAPTRERLRGELRRVLAEFAIPTIVVTHDRVEALTLADEILVMIDGAIEQQGPIGQVFSQPASAAVAQVVGVETVELARVVEIIDGLATVEIQDRRLTAVAVGTTLGSAYVCIRGEDVILHKGELPHSSARNRLTARVVALSPEGPLVRVHLDCGFHLTSLVTRPACAELDLQPGDEVTAVLKAPSIHLVPHG